MQALTAFQREVLEFLNDVRGCGDFSLEDIADNLGTSPQKAGQAVIRILASGRRLPVRVLYSDGSEVGSRALVANGRGRTPTYTLTQTVHRGRKKLAEKKVKIRGGKVIGSRSFQRKDAISMLLGDGYGRNFMLDFER